MQRFMMFLQGVERLVPNEFFMVVCVKVFLVMLWT